MQLILASSSPYRQQLLQQLGLPFICDSPAIDESAGPEETAAVLTSRLARQKAEAVAARHEDSLIIGSDQVCHLNGRILGKPGNRDNARRQLLDCSGNTAEFHTAIALFDSRNGDCLCSQDIYQVNFRTLSEAEIDAYLERDQPYDCAGSFKAESLGIALFDSMQGSDFHSLLGLPLISLCRLLREKGLNPLLAGL